MTLETQMTLALLQELLMGLRSSSEQFNGSYLIFFPGNSATI
ncbi:hypothetical protein SynROS8604_02774 [Synechococcus sp. ROS8604]|nr:hypothetical protein SynROS8604_02774 [Synechococcus sp. ROS8604]